MTDDQNKWCLMPDFKDANGTSWQHRIAFPDKPGVMPTNQRRQAPMEREAYGSDESGWLNFNLTELVQISVEEGVRVGNLDEREPASIKLPDFIIDGERYNRKFDDGREKFKRDDSARWRKFDLEGVITEASEDALMKVNDTAQNLGTFSFDNVTFEWGVQRGSLIVRQRVHNARSEPYDWRELSMDELLNDVLGKAGFIKDVLGSDEPVTVNQTFTTEPGIVMEVGITSKGGLVFRQKGQPDKPNPWMDFDIQRLLGDLSVQAYTSGQKAATIAPPPTDPLVLTVQLTEDESAPGQLRAASALTQVIQGFYKDGILEPGHLSGVLSFVQDVNS